MSEVGLTCFCCCGADVDAFERYYVKIVFTSIAKSACDTVFAKETTTDHFFFSPFFVFCFGLVLHCEVVPNWRLSVNIVGFLPQNIRKQIHKIPYSIANFFSDMTFKILEIMHNKCLPSTKIDLLNHIYTTQYVLGFVYKL